jgi:hypothetical protein
VTNLHCGLASDVTALIGFVLAVMHAAPKFYIPLYLAGPILMLVSYPRLPPTNDKMTTAHSIDA